MSSSLLMTNSQKGDQNFPGPDADIFSVTFAITAKALSALATIVSPEKATLF